MLHTALRALICALLATPAILAPLWPQAAPASLTLTPASQEIALESEALVEIRIEGATDLYGVELYLSFDPVIVEVVDAEPTTPATIEILPGSILAPGRPFLNRVDNASGEIHYAVIAAEPPGFSGNGLLASIRLRGIAPGTTSITCEHALLTAGDAAVLPHTTRNATVTVGTLPAEPTASATVPPPTATPTMIYKSTAVPTATAIPTATPSRTPTATLTPTPPEDCDDLVVNGGMEADLGWVLMSRDYPSGYSTMVAHSGSRSLRVGIENWWDNTPSYSNAYQWVYIPTGLTSATLRLWYYAHSGDWDDQQYIVLYRVLPDGTEKAIEPWVLRLAPAGNEQAWRYVEYDISAYGGQYLKLWVGCYNNGSGGITRLFIDDVSIQACR